MHVGITERQIEFANFRGFRPPGGATQKRKDEQQAGDDQEDHDISVFFKVACRPNYWPRSRPHGAITGKQSTRAASRSQMQRRMPLVYWQDDRLLSDTNIYRSRR